MLEGAALFYYENFALRFAERGTRRNGGEAMGTGFRGPSPYAAVVIGRPIVPDANRLQKGKRAFIRMLYEWGYDAIC
jgi:hypothetical protein